MSCTVPGLLFFRYVKNALLYKIIDVFLCRFAQTCYIASTKTKEMKVAIVHIEENIQTVKTTERRWNGRDSDELCDFVSETKTSTIVDGMRASVWLPIGEQKDYLDRLTANVKSLQNIAQTMPEMGVVAPEEVSVPCHKVFETNVSRSFGETVKIDGKSTLKVGDKFLVEIHQGMGGTYLRSVFSAESEICLKVGNEAKFHKYGFQIKNAEFIQMDIDDTVDGILQFIESEIENKIGHQGSDFENYAPIDERYRIEKKEKQEVVPVKVNKTKAANTPFAGLADLLK